jgi:hypothetical protein
VKQYLELNNLSYDVLGGFIEEAAHQDRVIAPFLLGKAAAYIDVAFVLDLITRAEAEELLLCIQIYQGM